MTENKELTEKEFLENIIKQIAITFQIPIELLINKNYG